MKTVKTVALEMIASDIKCIGFFSEDSIKETIINDLRMFFESNTELQKFEKEIIEIAEYKYKAIGQVGTRAFYDEVEEFESIEEFNQFTENYKYKGEWKNE